MGASGPRGSPKPEAPSNHVMLLHIILYHHFGWYYTLVLHTTYAVLGYQEAHITDTHCSATRGLTANLPCHISKPSLRFQYRGHIEVSINWGSQILGSSYEGSYYFGSIFGAPDFWKLPYGDTTWTYLANAASEYTYQCTLRFPIPTTAAVSYTCLICVQTVSIM